MRLGLFLSRHHGEISEVVDLEALAGQYTDVTTVKVYDHFFGETEQHDILKHVKKENLEAVVLGGYSANQFEIGRQGRAFVNTLKSIGVNQNRIVFTNLYEQLALAHKDQPQGASQKAKLLVDTALAKARHCHAIDTLSVRPTRAVLVVGTTESAILAAKDLLANDFAVHLVETRDTWQLRNPGSDTAAAIIREIEGNANATVMFNAEISDLSGWHGDYIVSVHHGRGDHNINVGGILLCLGNDRKWIDALRPHLRLDTDKNGYLVNINGKRSLGRTREPGMWLVPVAEGKEQKDPLSDQVGRVIKAVTTSLNKDRIEHPVLVSEVDENLCGGCGTCVKTCAFSASSVDMAKKTSLIDAKRCKGCGNCVTACPTNARDLVTFPTLYVNKAIEILSQGAGVNGDPKILAFLCKNSGYMAADSAGRIENQAQSGSYSPNVMPLRIECGGNIDTVYILKALREGFDGIAMVICKDNHCHNVVGNTDMERRIGLLRALLRSRKMDDNRMRIIHTYGHQGQRLNQELREFSDYLKKLNSH